MARAMSKLLTLVVSLAPLAGLVVAGDEARPKEYWTAIVRSGYALPAGADATELLLELSAHLGARDSELRDDCAYGIAARWIVTEGRVDAEGLRRLLARWSANLEVGLGERGTDSVLLRSFSALNLSLLAARDLDVPFLEQAEFDELLGSTVAYLEAERDLRGFVPELGWCHGIAHAADLARFLARNPKLAPDGQALLLFALSGRATAPVEEVLVHGEDDRLANALSALIARADFDGDAFVAALEPFSAALAAARGGAFDLERHAVATNARNVLRALHVRLAAAGELGPAQAAARAAVLDVLVGR